MVDYAKVRWTPTTSGPIQPAFINLEFPLRHELAVDGPDDFENFRVGVDLRGEFFRMVKPLPYALRADVGYAYEEFYSLDDGLHLFTIRVGTSF